MTAEAARQLSIGGQLAVQVRAMIDQRIGAQALRAYLGRANAENR